MTVITSPTFTWLGIKVTTTLVPDCSNVATFEGTLKFQEIGENSDAATKLYEPAQ